MRRALHACQLGTCDVTERQPLAIERVVAGHPVAAAPARDRPAAPAAGSGAIRATTRAPSPACRAGARASSTCSRARRPRSGHCSLARARPPRNDRRRGTAAAAGCLPSKGAGRRARRRLRARARRGPVDSGRRQPPVPRCHPPARPAAGCRYGSPRTCRRPPGTSRSPAFVSTASLPRSSCPARACSHNRAQSTPATTDDSSARDHLHDATPRAPHDALRSQNAA